MNYSSPFDLDGDPPAGGATVGIYTPATHGPLAYSSSMMEVHPPLSSSSGSSDDDDSSSDVHYSVSGRSAHFCSMLLKAVDPRRFLEAALSGRVDFVTQMVKEAEKKVRDALSLSAKTDWYTRRMSVIRMGLQTKQAEKLKRDIWLDFDECARLYGTVIIAEKHLPNELKSIPCADLGGVAGGQKFIHAGIVFKFSQDPHLGHGAYLYGGHSADHAAAHKAAGHELKGADWIFRRAGDLLLAPQMTLIDFRGERLTAQSLVPIDGSSLVYGSADAGTTIHTASQAPHYVQRIESAAVRFNLAPHRVQDASGQIHTISFPVDIEIHASTRDPDMLLCLDTARLMPPLVVQEESTRQQDIWFKLFRPEFLARYPHTLSSDSFSGFGRLDGATHNTAAREAARFFLEETLPRVVTELESRSSHSHVSKFLQDRGVNARFLGRVWALLRQSDAKKAVLLEMISRSAGKKLRLAWRSEPSGVSSTAAVSLAVIMLNELKETKQEPAWLRTALRDKYGSAHIPAPDQPLHHFEALPRLLEICGIRVKQKALLESDPIAPSDVVLEARVKRITANSVIRTDELWDAVKTEGLGAAKRESLIRKAVAILERTLTANQAGFSAGFITVRLSRFKLLALKLASSVTEMDRATLDLEHTLSLLPLNSFEGLMVKTKAKVYSIQKVARWERDTRGAALLWFEARDLIVKMSVLTDDPTDPWYRQGKDFQVRVGKIRKKLYEECAPLIWDTILVSQDYEALKGMVELFESTPFVTTLSGLHAGHWRVPKYFWLAMTWLSGSDNQCCISLKNSLITWLGKTQSLDPHALTHCAVDDSVLRQLLTLNHEYESLILRHCIVTDSSLHAIAKSNCQSMCEIFLEGCNLLRSESVAHLLKSAQLLKHFTVQDCAMIGGDAIWRALPQGLISVTVSSCPRITSPNPKDDFKFPEGLSNLAVSDCPSMIWTPALIFALPTCIVCFKADDLSAMCAAALPASLHTLSLNSLVLEGSELRLPLLRSMKLENGEVAAALVCLARNSPLLEELDLKNCVQLDSWGSCLTQFKNLRALRIDGATQLGMQDIVAPLLESGARLDQCALFGTTDVPAIELTQVLNLHQLSEICIDYPPSIGFLDRLIECHHLKKVSLSDCPLFSESSWASFCEIAKCLETLSLKRFLAATEEKMSALLRGAQQLLHLTLQNLPLVQGTCMKESSGWPNLLSLELVSCFFDQSSLTEVISKSLKLERLRLDTSGACDVLLETLALSCPYLRLLHISAPTAPTLRDPRGWIARMALEELSLGTPEDVARAVVPKLKYEQLRNVILCHGTVREGEVRALSRLPSLSSCCLNCLFWDGNNSSITFTHMRELFSSTPVATCEFLARQTESISEVVMGSKCITRISVFDENLRELSIPAGLFPAHSMTFSCDATGFEGVKSKRDLLRTIQSMAVSFPPLPSLFAVMFFWGDPYSMRTLTSLLERGYEVICAVVEAELHSGSRLEWTAALRETNILRHVHWISVNMKGGADYGEAFREQVRGITGGVLHLALLHYPTTRLPGEDGSARVFKIVRVAAVQFTDPDEYFHEMFESMVFVPAKMLFWMGSFLKNTAGSKICFFYHNLGSLSECSASFFLNMRMAFASVQMLCKAGKYEFPKSIVFGVHYGPGMFPGVEVRDKTAVVSPEASALKLMHLMDDLTMDQSGKCFRFPGECAI